MPQIIAIVLLVASLIVFIISTRQWPLLQRSLIWGVGAALLAASALLGIKGGQHDTLLRAMADAVSDVENSLLVRAIASNWTVVAGYIPAMFDLLILFGALAGLLALIAFTPGESAERVTRSLCVGLFGALGGSIVTLAIVAIGFGGYPKRQLYFDALSAEDVVDGDTIRMGDVSFRLSGIDAPEYSRKKDGTPGTLNQFCYQNEQRVDCGADARDAVIKLVSNAIVVCAKPSESSTLEETYGRPVVECEVRPAPNGAADVAKHLLANGLAIRSTGDDCQDHSTASESSQGKRSCMLKPCVWRQDKLARTKFLNIKPGLSRSDFVNLADCPSGLQRFADRHPPKSGKKPR
jgi:endonuclease YncB( thermonuclease family)